jgi:hypothetical protein
MLKIVTAIDFGAFFNIFNKTFRIKSKPFLKKAFTTV